MDDIELLQAWRKGDRIAGEELFERHYPMVERFFRNKVAEPEELVQQTFVTCVEAKTRFRGDSKFSTFVLGIAINVLRRHYRQIQQHDIPTLHASSVADLGQTPSHILADRDEERLLLEALRRLPVELQLVVELCYWEHLKQEELAELLQLPRSTINSRLRRARELLERNLHELVSSPQLLHSTLTHLHDWAEQQRRGGSLALHRVEPSP